MDGWRVWGGGEVAVASTRCGVSGAIEVRGGGGETHTGSCDLERGREGGRYIGV